MNSRRIIDRPGLELPPAPAENRRMDPRGWPSLAIPLLLVGAAAFAADADITVYRCVSAAGAVTLQDEPCPAGQQETTRAMTRPQDPPPRAAPAAAARAPGAPEPAPGPPPPPFAGPWPPPPMFQCTDYDGNVRFTEDYAPNTRCVPLAVLGYRVPDGSPAAATCRWVHESCLRLDDEAACDQFEAKLAEARSNALHASATTAPYRRSEAERLQRIVDESCR
jgi:hypothetical protein